MATSKVDICNMALGYIGKYASINNIEIPIKSEEKVFATWYDNTRKALLRNTMPNFALLRRKVSLDATAPIFGYENAYEYPHDCLKLLGIGDIDKKCTNYSVEGGYIVTDEEYDDGLPIRFVADIKDVTKFTEDWADLLSLVLASKTCLQISEDNQRKAYIDSLLPISMSTVGSVNSQENPPIRVSYSRFMGARNNNNPSSVNKK